MVFEDIKPGARLRGLDPAGIAEVVQVSRFGKEALNLVFRVSGRVGERLVYRGEESSFELVSGGHAYAFDADGGLLRLALTGFGSLISSTPTSPSARRRSRHSPIRSRPSMARCCRASRSGFCSPTILVREKLSWLAF